MDIQTQLTTKRLLIEPLTATDKNFIFELVNTGEWIKFIGNRNITSGTEAEAYIQKILDNPDILYWIVKLKDNGTKIGIITFIKRDYLKYYDIGFAFLPEFTQKGYAYEAANAVLSNVINSGNHSHILATTVSENENSINLLKKLGLHFDKEIEVDKKKLHLYEISADKFRIDEISKSFFGIFTNVNDSRPEWDLLNSICIPETMIISKKENEHTVYNLTSFIEPRKKILTDGTLTEFKEYETFEQTIIFNNIAQRHSEFQKQGVLEGKSFRQKGHKYFQFVKTMEQWKISSVIWEDDNN
ncbi:GNAT family N-acetyltransferase [Chryseobacterium sp. MIQD13]|uniref:GNAT family N-acetyltransferase n=1 Tax=Chryseobacterium sp. MIQD13 TaxID=3422310 RepID=UPI003D2C8A97